LETADRWGVVCVRRGAARDVQIELQVNISEKTYGVRVEDRAFEIDSDTLED
jgi:hypothetical protein